MVTYGGARERARTVQADVRGSDASSGLGALADTMTSDEMGSGSDDDSNPRAMHAAQSASL